MDTTYPLSAVVIASSSHSIKITYTCTMLHLSLQCWMQRCKTPVQHSEVKGEGCSRVTNQGLCCMCLFSHCLIDLDQHLLFLNLGIIVQREGRVIKVNFRSIINTNNFDGKQTPYIFYLCLSAAFSCDPV